MYYYNNNNIIIQCTDVYICIYMICTCYDMHCVCVSLLELVQKLFKFYTLCESSSDDVISSKLNPSM